LDHTSGGSQKKNKTKTDLAFSSFVVVVVVDAFRQPARSHDERRVERVEEAAEVLQTLLHRQDDAVQDDGVVLEVIKLVKQSDSE
jgi:hypothetical protein